MKPIVLATVTTLGLVIGGAAIVEGTFVSSWQFCADDQPQPPTRVTQGDGGESFAVLNNSVIDDWGAPLFHAS